MVCLKLPGGSCMTALTVTLMVLSSPLALSGDTRQRHTSDISHCCLSSCVFGFWPSLSLLFKLPQRSGEVCFPSFGFLEAAQAWHKVITKEVFTG
uniref:Major histocompatibility complex, class II, DR beta 1 n=1 Tax=Homo sapiens TaxID=9606 RepID=A0A8Q3WLF4_HUMAN